MTAEVAVLNKFGVALAADSAITVDYFHQNEIKTKVYNTANKLFTLSKFEPVGIMYYNAVTLGGVPWETIIKLYRRQLHRTVFSTIDEYCDDFFAWLNRPDNNVFIPEHLAGIVRRNIMRQFIALEKKAKTKGQFRTVLEKEIADLGKVDYVDGFGARDAIRLASEYQEQIERAANVCLRRSWVTGLKRKIRKYCGLLLTKKKELPNYSGIVIAGFGEAESLPHLREFMVDIIVGSKVRVWRQREINISENNASEVVPLADAEVIKTLIEGISPSFEHTAYVGALNLILEMPKKILEPITELTNAQKQKYIADARRALPQHFTNFSNNMSKHREEEYTEPIKQAISSLPVSELGLVAETFLGASQIQKRVSPELETIGGPVDVAVISKGDGFEWIKRKHYFDEALNPSFKQKYLDGVVDGDTNIGGQA